MNLTTTAAYDEIIHCFQAALHNVLDINTVECDYSLYNATGLLEHPKMLQAGVTYGTPWTRDASINVWNCLRILAPAVAKNTLLAVCKTDETGAPIIQPDVQEWDQIIWTIGAWSYYLSTGDEGFLSVAYGIVGKALNKLADTRFVEKFGLFRGGSFFNDGIAGYPIDCYSQSQSSFAPDHPMVEQIMCLSTNCIYCEAYHIYSRMALHFGNKKLAKEAAAQYQQLKATIHQTFGNEDKQRYDYILFPDGRKDSSQEASGHIFAILFSTSVQRIIKPHYWIEWLLPTVVL